MHLAATRATWGFHNPNDAAAFGLLLLLALGIALRLAGTGRAEKKSKSGKVATLLPGVAGALLLGALLLTTASRGALVAALAAGVVLWVTGRRGGRMTRLCSLRNGLLVLGALLLLAGLAALTPLGQRLPLTGGTLDDSLTGRVPVYGSVPAMIAAAPEGWGQGMASASWHDWFEPVGGRENYRHLLSSHGTWLVEWPHWQRGFYIAMWCLLGVLSWPRRDERGWNRGMALPWVVAAFLLGCFNHVYRHPAVGSAGVAGGLLLLLERCIGWSRATAKWRPRLARRLAAAVVLTVVSGGALLTAGVATNRTPIVKKQGGWVLVTGGPGEFSPGESPSKDSPLPLVVPWVDREVLGQKFGHAVRQAASGHAGTIAVSPAPVTGPPPLVGPVRSLLLSGTPAAPDIATWLPVSSPDLSLCWINPPAATSPQAAEAVDLWLREIPGASFHLIWGAWRRDASARPWKEAASRHSEQVSFHTVPGTGRYAADPWRFFRNPSG